MSSEKISGWLYMLFGALAYTYAVTDTLNIFYALGLMLIPAVITLLIVKFTKAKFSITALIISTFYYSFSYFGLEKIGAV